MAFLTPWQNPHLSETKTFIKANSIQNHRHIPPKLQWYLEQESIGLKDGYRGLPIKQNSDANFFSEMKGRTQN